MSIPIEQDLVSDHRLTKDDWQDISQKAWAAAGEKWRRDILPKHFEVSAVAEYNYSPRSKDSEARKQLIYGHRRPMVATGLMRATVMGTGTVNAPRTKSKGLVKIKLRGPRYLKRGRLWFELRAVSRADEAILAKVLDRVIVRELGKNGPKTRTGQGR